MIPIDYAALAAGNLIFSTIVFAILASAFLSSRIFAEYSRSVQILAVLTVNGIAGSITLLLLEPSGQLLIPVFLGVFVNLAGTCLLRAFTFTGGLLMAAQAQFYLACLLWGLSVVASADVDLLSRILMLIGFVLASAYLLIALIQHLEQLEIICRRDLRLPQLPRTVAVGRHYPKVSLHIPVYSEPPDMVIATLNALAKLDYPNYEVLVIDNNTNDPSLWRPVQMHCQRLGERYRFFHVDRLAGAKAGALNFALRHTSSDLELIGVVDSDYRVNRNYVSSLVHYFDDPKIGFVQTPHAYRDWERYPYLRMCNWEYSIYLSSTLVSRNERMAAITLGTMGLIRRKLLEEVGAWAEWCLTEDSELALRIHARGYRSVYINAVCGRGLIPETFRDYKRQRFRWRFGSIQELRRHFRIFLPRPLARASELAATQKLSHLMHALDTLKALLEFLVLVVGTMLAIFMLLQEEAIHLSRYIWLVLIVRAISNALLKWHVFRTLGWSLRDTVGALVAGAALDHTFAMAGLAALLTRNTAWRKTNKFRPIPDGFKALGAVMPELLLGSVTSVASVALLFIGNLSGFLVLLSIGGLLKGAKYLLAPMMAVLAEQGICRRAAEPLLVPET